MDYSPPRSCLWDFPGKIIGVGFPFSGDLPDPGIKPVSLARQGDSLPLGPILQYKIKMKKKKAIKIIILFAYLSESVCFP